MTVTVYTYTIYHSPNAYLGSALSRRALAGLPEIELAWRPIYISRELRTDRRRAVNRQRYFGKDRVDWAIVICRTDDAGNQTVS